MYSAFRALLIRELQEVEKTVKICHKRLQRKSVFTGRGEEDILADSLAACLHSFYTGLENIFETIALELDGGIPKGERWHKKLLTQMASTIPGVRPSILSEKSIDHLNEYRAFRHLFRNLYTHNLKPKRVFQLVGNLKKTWLSVDCDMKKFIGSLEMIDAE